MPIFVVPSRRPSPDLIHRSVIDISEPLSVRIAGSARVVSRSISLYMDSLSSPGPFPSNPRSGISHARAQNSWRPSKFYLLLMVWIGISLSKKRRELTLIIERTRAEPKAIRAGSMTREAFGWPRQISGGRHRAFSIAETLKPPSTVTTSGYDRELIWSLCSANVNSQYINGGSSAPNRTPLGICRRRPRFHQEDGCQMFFDVPFSRLFIAYSALYSYFWPINFYKFTT